MQTTAKAKKTYYTYEGYERYRKTKSNEIGFDIAAFHVRARRYVKRNKIDISHCLACGKKTRTQLHHPSYEDYTKWSYVVPLCCSCHRKVHHNILECPEAIELIELAKDKRKNDLFYKRKTRCKQ